MLTRIYFPVGEDAREGDWKDDDCKEEEPMSAYVMLSNEGVSVGTRVGTSVGSGVGDEVAVGTGEGV
jgi:hypothetical protein